MEVGYNVGRLARSRDHESCVGFEQGGDLCCCVQYVRVRKGLLLDNGPCVVQGSWRKEVRRFERANAILVRINKLEKGRLLYNLRSPVAPGILMLFGARPAAVIPSYPMCPRGQERTCLMLLPHMSSMATVKEGQQTPNRDVQICMVLGRAEGCLVVRPRCCN